VKFRLILNRSNRFKIQRRIYFWWWRADFYGDKLLNLFQEKPASAEDKYRRVYPLAYGDKDAAQTDFDQLVRLHLKHKSAGKKSKIIKEFNSGDKKEVFLERL